MPPDRFINRQIISIVFSCAILLGAFIVLSPFLLAIIWAAIIAIASWPLHVWMEQRMPHKATLAALASTGVICLLLVGPMVLLIVFLTQDIIALSNYLILADAQGVPPPVWLVKLPWIGETLLLRWNEYLAQPDRLSGVVREMLSVRLSAIQDTAQVLLVDLSGRIATLFFALWVLFFFYREGRPLTTRLNRVGYKWLERRWPAYVHLMPDALRAAVNGLVIVGFGEAVLLSVLFYIFGVPSAVLLGLATAVLAFVPMAAPLLLAVIGFILFASGAVTASIFVVSFGLVIVLGADYLVRPALIQGGTQLPFLAILFGIFGGVVTMGVVGLIIGPVLLVLLLVFFREAALDEQEVSLDFDTNDGN